MMMAVPDTEWHRSRSWRLSKVVLFRWMQEPTWRVEDALLEVLLAVD